MIAYFDCFSGISGDMILGAFIDLGVPVKWLKNTLSSIPLTGFDISVTSVSRNGINAKSVHVKTEDNVESRNYAEIRSLIQNSRLSPQVKERSLEAFRRLAEAEAAIHGRPVDKVHFHELGGIDAIVDIVSAALCVEYLGIEKIISSKLPLGTGFVDCRHGALPVPAPATLAILRDAPVYGSGIPHELVTPTGAAIIVTLAESFETMPHMLINKTGYGAGKRDLESIPNLLRIVTGNAQNHKAYAQKDRVVLVETCIDDMNPEIFGFVMDRLFEDGALDVYWIPIFMKKNRPGTMVQVLCRTGQKEAVINRILSETTSLGVRYYDVDRAWLSREQITVKTGYGMVQVKRITDTHGAIRIVPEYEVCKKIALEKNIPIRVVYDIIAKEGSQQCLDKKHA
ncbi:MAG: nickel pincer cofactor biosynthesis protein LarC [Desulfobacteraceae bacterium]|nr:nickel pincer cofactor biosynthesis protein LarC [Desulfobacteraceae bacterium]